MTRLVDHRIITADVAQEVDRLLRLQPVALLIQVGNELAKLPEVDDDRVASPSDVSARVQRQVLTSLHGEAADHLKRAVSDASDVDRMRGVVEKLNAELAHRTSELKRLEGLRVAQETELERFRRADRVKARVVGIDLADGRDRLSSMYATLDDDGKLTVERLETEQAERLDSVHAHAGRSPVPDVLRLTVREVRSGDLRTAYAIVWDHAKVDGGARIPFQHGEVKDHGWNGATMESLLLIVADRLRTFQAGPYPSNENLRALTAVETAIATLGERTRRLHASQPVDGGA